MDMDKLARDIAEVTLDPTDEELELLELEKQYGFLTYADDAADLDAEFYGVA